MGGGSLYPSLDMGLCQQRSQIAHNWLPELHARVGRGTTLSVVSLSSDIRTVRPKNTWFFRAAPTALGYSEKN